MSDGFAALIRKTCQALWPVFGIGAIISGGISLWLFFSSMYKPGQMLDGLFCGMGCAVTSLLALITFAVANHADEESIKHVVSSHYLKAPTWQVGIVVALVLFAAGLTWNFMR